jgi:hypothetical protein
MAYGASLTSVAELMAAPVSEPLSARIAQNVRVPALGISIL